MYSGYGCVHGKGSLSNGCEVVLSGWRFTSQSQRTCF